MIIGVHRTTLTPKALSHNLSPLIIKHAFVRNFLKACSRVLVHLTALNDPLPSVPSDTLRTSRILLLNGSAVVHFDRADHCLMLETLAWTVCEISTELKWSRHLFAHLVHHLIHLLKWVPSEERIRTEKSFTCYQEIK